MEQDSLIEQYIFFDLLTNDIHQYSDYALEIAQMVLKVMMSDKNWGYPVISDIMIEINWYTCQVKLSYWGNTLLFMRFDNLANMWKFRKK